MRSQARGLAAAVGLGTLLIAAAPGAARTPDACDADVQKLCKGIESGRGRVYSCLRSHGSELSDACKQALKERSQGGYKSRWVQPSRAWASACAGDIELLCQGIPAGAGRIAECLHAHQSKLSDACRLAFAPTPAK